MFFIVSKRAESIVLRLIRHFFCLERRKRVVWTMNIIPCAAQSPVVFFYENDSPMLLFHELNL
jgi:hypothetical protein